jgi:hypothetical protein
LEDRLGHKRERLTTKNTNYTKREIKAEVFVWFVVSPLPSGPIERGVGDGGHGGLVERESQKIRDAPRGVLRIGRGVGVADGKQFEVGRARQSAWAAPTCAAKVRASVASSAWAGFPESCTLRAAAVVPTVIPSMAVGATPLPQQPRRLCGHRILLLFRFFGGFRGLSVVLV